MNRPDERMRPLDRGVIVSRTVARFHLRYLCIHPPPDIATVESAVSPLFASPEAFGRVLRSDPLSRKAQNPTLDLVVQQFG
jgi:hypothetical protein